MNTDSISDMLTRIRNAQAVGHKTVIFPFSKIKFELAKILSAKEFIGAVSEKEKGPKKKIEVVLNYKDAKNTIPKIQGIIRVSRGGQRIYVGKKDLLAISKGRGIAILTTSQGLMIDREAKRKGTGGEIICKIW